MTTFYMVISVMMVYILTEEKQKDLHGMSLGFRKLSAVKCEYKGSTRNQI